MKKNYKIIFMFNLHLSPVIMHYSPCVRGSSSQSNCHIAINEILDCLSLSKQSIKKRRELFVPGSLQGL